MDYKKETIIIGSGGNPVIHMDINFSCSTDNHLLKSKNNNIKNYWIYYLLKSVPTLLENGFIGTTIKHISKSYLQKLKIPIPALNVQQKLEQDIHWIKITKELIKKWESKGNKLIQQLYNNAQKNKLFFCNGKKREKYIKK